MLSAFGLKGKALPLGSRDSGRWPCSSTPARSAWPASRRSRSTCRRCLTTPSSMTSSMPRSKRRLLKAARDRDLETVDGLDDADRPGGARVRAVLRRRAAARPRRRAARAADVMIILGLTGSIGMGKSTVAAMFAEGRAGVRRRCRGAPAAGPKAAGWSRRSRRRFPARPGRKASTGPCSASAVLGRAASAEAARGAGPSGGGAGAGGVSGRACASAGGRARHPAAVRDRRRKPGRQGRGGLRRARGPARARARPARHDRGEVRRDPRAASCPMPRSARAPISSSRPTAARLKPGPRSAASSLASPHPDPDIEGHARNRLRHRNHRPQLRRRRPDGRDRLRRDGQPGRDRPHLPRLFQSRAGRCRARPRRCTACPTLSSPTSRCFHERARSCSSSSATAPLVAHNAGFDFGFINRELGHCGRPAVCTSTDGRHARPSPARNPGAKHSLDALCTPLRRRPLASASSTARCSTRNCSPKSMSS